MNAKLKHNIDFATVQNCSGGWGSGCSLNGIARPTKVFCDSFSHMPIAFHIVRVIQDSRLWFYRKSNPSMRCCSESMPCPVRYCHLKIFFYKLLGTLMITNFLVLFKFLLVSRWLTVFIFQCLTEPVWNDQRAKDFSSGKAEIEFNLYLLPSCVRPWESCWYWRMFLSPRKEKGIIFNA